MSLVEEALTKYLSRQGDALGEPTKLRYSKALSPDACERELWYSIRGVKKDPIKIGKALRFHGGRVNEKAIVEALRENGEAVLSQVEVRPTRPSSKAWATGHADAVLVHRKRLLEIKAPRARLFHMASNDPRRLAWIGYRYQASAYYWHLKEKGLVESGGWVFLDREGSNAPVELELEGELLVPLDAIIEQEIKRTPLTLPETPLPRRLPLDIHFKALKGRGKDGNHIAEWWAELPWQCRGCDFAGTCRPGPETRPHEPTGFQRVEALSMARDRWAEDKSATDVVYGVTPNDGESSAAQSKEKASEQAAASTSAPHEGIQF